MHFINKNFFGFEFEDKGNSTIIKLHTLVKPKKNDYSDKYQAAIDKVKKNCNAFINIKVAAKLFGKDNEDASNTEMYAYHHQSKGKEVTWITTDEQYGPWSDACGVYDTYFIAIPYKQTISAIECSEGVEIMKVTSRSYAKVYGAKGIFTWRNPEKKYDKDSSEGTNFSKTLYMIVNVRRDAKKPCIKIHEVRIPKYAIQKATEANNDKANFYISTSVITLDFPENNTSVESSRNFYPNAFITRDTLTLAEAQELEERTKQNIMNLVTKIPVNNT